MGCASRQETEAPGDLRNVFHREQLTEAHGFLKEYDDFVRKRMNDRRTPIAELYAKFFDLRKMERMDSAAFADRYFSHKCGAIDLAPYDYPIMLEIVRQTGSGIMVLCLEQNWIGGKSPVALEMFRGGILEFDYRSEIQRIAVVRMICSKYAQGEDYGVFNVVSGLEREKCYKVIGAYDDFVRKRMNDTVTPIGELYGRFLNVEIEKANKKGNLDGIIPGEGYDEQVAVFRDSWEAFWLRNSYIRILVELVRRTGNKDIADYLDTFNVAGCIAPSIIAGLIGEGWGEGLDFDNDACRLIIAYTFFDGYFCRIPVPTL